MNFTLFQYLLSPFFGGWEGTWNTLSKLKLTLIIGTLKILLGIQQ